MKCKVIIFLLLVLIVVMNFRLNILVIEGYCTGTNNEVTNPMSPYYDGIQDAFLFANDNIGNVNVRSGLARMNYDDSLQSEQCKKLGFENGITMYSSGRNEIKDMMDNKFNVSEVSSEFQEDLNDVEV